MRKLLLILPTLILLSCSHTNEQSKSVVSVDGVDNQDHQPTTKKIIGRVHNGLHLVKIDDTTTILIYSGFESVAMIQLK